MKICPRLLIFELSDCTLRIFRGYDFSNFLILLILDRYFGGFDSDLRASPPVCLAMECPPGLSVLLSLCSKDDHYPIRLSFSKILSVGETRS